MYMYHRKYLSQIRKYIRYNKLWRIQLSWDSRNPSKITWTRLGVLEKSLTNSNLNLIWIISRITSWKLQELYYFSNFVFYNGMSKFDIFDSHMLARVVEVLITTLFCSNWALKKCRTRCRKCRTWLRIKISIYSHKE